MLAPKVDASVPGRPADAEQLTVRYIYDGDTLQAQARRPGRYVTTTGKVRVRLIGIDAWGLDRPFDVMAEEAKAGDTAQLWESHVLGRSKEYCQIERLANLDLLPRPTGFTVYAFPYLVEDASAGWTRVVAIFEEDA